MTCLWSRAINLQLCRDLTMESFLKAFQIHTFQYGVPEYAVSDLGSQIVPATNLIHSFLNDPETQLYFHQNNVKSLKFEQFPKGCKELGSLVESCVKLVKKLIHGAIGKIVLEYFDFEFLIHQTISIVNRRPIAFKEVLRDDSNNLDLPMVITPEILLRGHEVTALNLIPGLQSQETLDPDWLQGVEPIAHIKTSYDKLRDARKVLVDLYNREFLGNLIYQATNEQGRYKPVFHDKIKVGDIVLIKDEFVKPTNYPLAIVREVITNDLGEVTSASVFKGVSPELVKRHVSSLIPLLSTDDNRVVDGSSDIQTESDGANSSKNKRPIRKTAVRSQQSWRRLRIGDQI